MIVEETHRLQAEIEAANKENANFAVFEKKYDQGNRKSDHLTPPNIY